MRVDKLLWALRYFKTRNQATTSCKKGHIKINGQQVKPSKEVYPKDEISIRKNQVNYELRVNDLPPNRVGAKLVDVYRVDKTPKEQFKNQELLKYAQNYYRKKGTGRPTKKDRRNINDYLDDETT